MTCYILHFDRPYKHARHYLGCTTDLEQRLEQHRTGRGARLMEVIAGAGIGFTLARVWPKGDFKFEKRLKHQKHNSRLCPICNPHSVRAGNMPEPVGAGLVPALPAQSAQGDPHA